MSPFNLSDGLVICDSQSQRGTSSGSLLDFDLPANRPWDEHVPTYDNADQIAADAAPDEPTAAMDAELELDRVPILDPGNSWMTVIPVNLSKMREAEMIAGFYEGRVFEKGRQLHREYLERKAERELQS